MKASNIYKDDSGNSVKILGMTGLIFSNTQNEEYFVDSELSVGDQNDIVLFKERVSYKDDQNKKISDLKGKKIIEKITEILRSNKIKYLLL